MIGGEKMKVKYESSFDKYDKLTRLCESKKLNEGYETHCLEILDDAGIYGSFGDGILYVYSEDIKKAKKALEDSGEIYKLPKIVAIDKKRGNR